MTMSEEDINKKAKEMAQIILDVNTDFRGNLFEEVSEELMRQSQGFTSSVMNMAANIYGIAPNKPSGCTTER